MKVPTRTPRTPATPLLEAKQQLVREAIANAAIDLFVAKGFDETTVDEIAKAAGVSRRSFFRYFSSKNDLMGETIVVYGRALTEAIAAAPRSYSPLEVVRDAVLRISAAAAAYPHTRRFIQIIHASPAARQAQLSRSGEVKDRVARAFSARLGGGRAGGTAPKLLADLTLSIMDVTLQVWYDERGSDISDVAERVLADLRQVVQDRSAPPARR